ncbi:hypothetical protein BST18_23010 [Mycobacteroides abscessus subsp. bolletii]|nr:hypothetical protein BST18_23010 [Mycobacteroides abscessus subsp. bolletii]
MLGTDSVSDLLASTIRGNDGVGLYCARVARGGWMIAGSLSPACIGTDQQLRIVYATMAGWT